MARVTTAFGATDDEYKITKEYKKYAAIKAMEYIQANVSSARYSYEKFFDQESFNKPIDANDALRRGIGICGNQIAVFLAVMEELGIKARAIQFWYENEPGVRFSHIGAEVFYDNGWHYQDVTWGAYFTSQNSTDILSIEEVMADTKRRLYVNEMNVWYQKQKEKFGEEGVFSYLYKDADITIDYVGEVRAYSISNGDGSYSFPLLHIPNYIGDNKVDDKLEGIKYSFDVPEGKYQVEFKLLGQAGCINNSLYINDKEVIFDKKIAKIIIDDPKIAEVRGEGVFCYYVLKDIEMEKLN